MGVRNHLHFGLGLIDIPNPIKPFVEKLIKHTMSSITEVKVQALPDVRVCPPDALDGF